MVGNEIFLGAILLEPDKPKLNGPRLHVAYGGFTEHFVRTVIINHWPEKVSDNKMSVNKIKGKDVIIINIEQAVSFMNKETNLNGRLDSCVYPQKRINLIARNYESLFNFSAALKYNRNIDEYLSCIIKR